MKTNKKYTMFRDHPYVGYMFHQTIIKQQHVGSGSVSSHWNWDMVVSSL